MKKEKVSTLSGDRIQIPTSATPPMFTVATDGCVSVRQQTKANLTCDSNCELVRLLVMYMLCVIKSDHSIWLGEIKIRSSIFQVLRIIYLYMCCLECLKTSTVSHKWLTLNRETMTPSPYISQRQLNAVQFGEVTSLATAP